MEEALVNNGHLIKKIFSKRKLNEPSFTDDIVILSDANQNLSLLKIDA